MAIGNKIRETVDNFGQVQDFSDTHMLSYDPMLRSLISNGLKAFQPWTFDIRQMWMYLLWTVQKSAKAFN